MKFATLREPALPPELVVGHLGQAIEVNRVDGDGRAPIDGAQRGAHDVAGRRERDGRVERLGRRDRRSPCPLGAQRQRALLFRRRARRDEDAAAPVARDLQRDQRRGAEAVQAEAAARLGCRCA